MVVLIVMFLHISFTCADIQNFLVDIVSVFALFALFALLHIYMAGNYKIIGLFQDKNFDVVFLLCYMSLNVLTANACLLPLCREEMSNSHGCILFNG